MATLTNTKLVGSSVALLRAALTWYADGEVFEGKLTLGELPEDDLDAAAEALALVRDEVRRLREARDARRELPEGGSRTWLTAPSAGGSACH